MLGICVCSIACAQLPKLGIHLQCVRKRRCTVWGKGGVLQGEEEAYCMGKRRCTAWGRGGVLHGEEEVYCMGKRRCTAWGRGGVLHGEEEVSLLNYPSGQQS